MKSWLHSQYKTSLQHYEPYLGSYLGTRLNSRQSLRRTNELVKWHYVSCCHDQNPPVLAEALFPFHFIDTFPGETNVRLLARFSSLDPMKVPLHIRKKPP